MSQKSLEKFKELLIYVVKHFNDNETLTETKLWKLLYFCEADFYEKFNHTITGVDYYKNLYGATPAKVVINRVLPQAKDYVKTEKIKKDSGKIMTVFKPHNDYKYKALSANEIEQIRKTCEKYFRLSVSDITILAHQDPPYLGAEKGKKIDFRFVNYREDKDIEEIEDVKTYSGTISDEAAENLLTYVAK
ncbi:hypothetical protein COY61_00760 [bacterium (Candidatus Gribaldobacteria) CG_4_10_14_0_8_um_filter_33_9]|uniref:Antitoxin SocA-like Panacea domain-containing protein n=1 Tax=bacterium (Candidatus Gribaldobacteria) CG_4_10_14_0_8_um_filter_33_9 TaxID=2014266 RepID=A0A2M7RPP4_9BACT|nr:MAG: hypothetical protein COY61_00760 [bacterium (Candidatus Gribaldobacteria) CG_4_10_14_0_8_um_filter_33_9]